LIFLKTQGKGGKKKKRRSKKGGEMKGEKIKWDESIKFSPAFGRNHFKPTTREGGGKKGGKEKRKKGGRGEEYWR